jgi:tyrosine-protein phosphatase SIW14
MALAHRPPTALAHRPPTARLSTVIPPEKFGVVEPRVYRSAFPGPDSFTHLKLLGLHTVVNLSQEAVTRPVLAFFAEAAVEVVDVGLAVWTHPSCTPTSPELINEAMRYVLDPARHPLLIMSSSGTHQVGALVGCLRRLQRWNLASVFEEYRAYSAPNSRTLCEQFIELWDPDLLTLPRALPGWFVAGAALEEEDVERWHDECERIGLGVDSTSGGECSAGEDGGFSAGESFGRGGSGAAVGVERYRYFGVDPASLAPRGTVTSLVPDKEEAPD